MHSGTRLHPKQRIHSREVNRKNIIIASIWKAIATFIEMHIMLISCWEHLNSSLHINCCSCLIKELKAGEQFATIASAKYYTIEKDPTKTGNFEEAVDFLCLMAPPKNEDQHGQRPSQHQWALYLCSWAVEGAWGLESFRQWYEEGLCLHKKRIQ
jgi:hypothetical protein